MLAGGRVAGKLAGDTLNAVNRWEHLAIIATVVLSILTTTFLSKALDVPRGPEFSPSLVVGAPAFISVVTALLVIISCGVVGSLIMGHAHYDAGIFAAGVGLTTLSVRGGSIGVIFRSASGAGLFGGLLLELLLLAAFLFGISAILEKLSGSRLLRDESLDDVQNAPEEMEQPTRRNKVMALLVQMVTTLVLAAILLQVDSKKQVLTSLFIASFIASVGAHHLYPIRGGAWFWSGPLIAGLLAYAFSLAATDPDLLRLGVPSLAIANATPLDYAGLGVSGSLFGYWASRRWHRERAALANPIDEVTAIAE